MNDFDTWYRFTDQSIRRERAKEIYDSVFTCTCTTCMYRKERGFIPLRITQDCTAPIDLSELERLVEDEMRKGNM